MPNIMASDIFRPEINSKSFKIKFIAKKFLITEFISTSDDEIKIFRDNPIIIKGNAKIIIFSNSILYTFYKLLIGNWIRYRCTLAYIYNNRR